MTCCNHDRKRRRLQALAALLAATGLGCLCLAVGGVHIHVCPDELRVGLAVWEHAFASLRLASAQVQRWI